MRLETSHNASVSRPSVFASIAAGLEPTLHRWTRSPQRIVAFEPCQNSYFGVRSVASRYDLAKLPTLAWGKGDDFVFDFGIHMVGFLSFQLSLVGANMDSPCRLRLTFGESPLDVTMSMNGPSSSWISTAWLPDEIINIDECPEIVTIRRRHAFRYLRVEVIDTSKLFKVAFSNVECECISAVSPLTELEMFNFGNSSLLQDIDRVSIFTLRDCMQSVFEDGPRRDRRIWIGDLRLQALASYCTIRDFDLVKKCLFQFAAVARDDGSLPACYFEKPILKASDDYIVDYDALFGPVIYDYVAASGDLETGRLLWTTALRCLVRSLSHLNPSTYVFEPERSRDWKFLDWNTEVDITAGSHGVLLYSLKAVAKLAQLLDLDFPHNETIERMTEAAKTFLKDGVVVSGPKAQISYSCTSWLVLAEAFPQETASQVMLGTLTHTEAIKPLTPYAWHHVCEALVVAGCEDECLDLLKSYWGGMIKAGADTFWEAYDPEDPRASPYGDVRVNSFCHAWSCTPTLLLRNHLREKLNCQPAGKMTMRDLDNSWIQRSLQTN